MMNGYTPPGIRAEEIEYIAFTGFEGYGVWILLSLHPPPPDYRSGLLRTGWKRTPDPRVGLRSVWQRTIPGSAVLQDGIGVETRR